LVGLSSGFECDLGVIAVSKLKGLDCKNIIF